MDFFRHAFEKQRKLKFLCGIPQDVEAGGRTGFIFTSKSGRPMIPNALNNVLKNIVNAYNKQEREAARRENRREGLMPHISAHVLRHTACTRMAERRMDMKVLQYIMGHAHIDVTMEVYNHLGDWERVAQEIARLDGMSVNF